MNVQATLMIAGDVNQALQAVAAHDIGIIKSATEQPDEVGKVTKVIINSEVYGKEIERWFNEKQPQGGRVPGSLIGATWV